MPPGSQHEIVDLRQGPGELSFEARIGDRTERVWFRTADAELTPNADAALATCLMPAMRLGGTLTLPAPISARLLRSQLEYQAIQRAWSREWPFGDPPLEEVEVRAPSRPPEPGRQMPGRVAAFFSGGVDSWSTVLDHPELTDLIFVRGLDLHPDAAHQVQLADEVEARLRGAAGELGMRLIAVETNLRRLADPLARWEAYFGCAATAVALFLAPLFERVLIAGSTDYEVEDPIGVSRLVDRLWSTETLEIADDGGRFSRSERTRRIATHPVVQRTLRVCWQNPDGAYNCGRCRKCVTTMITLEALGLRAGVTSFPEELDLGVLDTVEFEQIVLLTLWEDLLDTCREAGRIDLEDAVEPVVDRGRRELGLSPGYRRRNFPGPPATIRIAVIVPVWRQSQYLAAAVASALEQRILTEVGVVIVNDGCPDPATHRIAQALRDANPRRVAYVRQSNQGVSAARNTGIRRAFARWPHLEAVFPLDADNMLSPETLAMLRDALANRPDAAWAAPTLEFFGAEEGEWSMPEPFLTYRQLFGNQTDTGSLIRRSVFAAGLEYDESIREGFEDWDFFLGAALAGFRGAHAGPCGFRYRCRPVSMLSEAQQQADSLTSELRRRHHASFRPGELARREHAEAPRFALVRCDLDDVLLTAACDLEPHRIPLAELLRPRNVRSAAPLWQVHVPAITVLTTSATLEWLGSAGLLAKTLLQLQERVRDHAIVGLRIERRTGALERLWGRRPDVPAFPVALALRTRSLATVAAAGNIPRAEDSVDLGPWRRAPGPLPDSALGDAMTTMRAAVRPERPLVPPGSQAEFFEYLHVDLGDTTLPWSEAGEPIDADDGMAA